MDPRPIRKQILDMLGFMTGLLAIGLAALSLAGFWGHRYHLLDLCSHFRPQYLFFGALFLAILLATKRRRMGVAALVSLFINIPPVASCYWRSDAVGEERGTPCRILALNVHSDNRRFDVVLALLAREAPDVIVLMEVTDAWTAALADVRVSHPFYLECPRDDNFGIAVYSRLPVKDLRYPKMGNSGVPSICGRLALPSAEVMLLATHPVPPVSGRGWRERNAQLGDIAAWVRDQTLPVVVAGDLNVTVFSPVYQRFARNAGLNNARDGRGVLPTWLRDLPYLSIGLDHCLVSPGIGVARARVGDDVGSDHWPFIADLLLPAVP